MASVAKFWTRRAYWAARLGDSLESREGVSRLEHPICGNERRPELAPVVESGPAALARYWSNADSKYAGLVKLSNVSIPGIT